MAMTIDGLRDQVRGRVIAPDDEGYDEARRVYNAMHDRRPAAIVCCSDAADVIAAVSAAREGGVDLVAGGGGPSGPGFGTCDGGLVIDLSAMRNVHVDPTRKTARVGGGALWGDL